MKETRWYPVLYMAALAAVFGTLVATTAAVTRGRVEAGERARLRARVLRAFGLEAPAGPNALDNLWRRVVEERADARGTYYAWVEGGRVGGYAFPFRAPGFWGPIDGVLAVDPSGRRILGLSIVRHQETPGLGGRITEAWFLEQFRGKPARPQAPGRDVLDFVFRKPGGSREVEAITGATQTSRRLGRFLNVFLRDLAGRPVFREGAGG